jgi:hypothetical protein
VANKTPKPAEIEYLASDGAHGKMRGWKSSHALGILYLGHGFSSVMLLSGMVVEDGFPTLDLCHEFNQRLRAEKTILAGAVDLEDFFERAGGREKAHEVVERVKREVLKNKGAKK